MFRWGKQIALSQGWGRRLIGLLVLGSLCASFVPLPVMRPGLNKDRSTPYPCMDRPCGCRSADECWRSCCCFSNVEKVAWAKEHRVQLPAFVLVAAERESKLVDTKPKSSCSGGSCQRSCCATGVGGHAESLAADCRQPKSEPGRSQSDAAPTDVKYVIGVYAQKCQGRGAYDLFAGWVLLPSSDVTTGPVLTSGWSRLTNETPGGLVREPLVPPPRGGAVPHWLA
ncbi:MAG: hypothetical protein ACK5Q5_02430 [Planctomycetaceae bacterium]